MGITLDKTHQHRREGVGILEQTSNVTDIQESTIRAQKFWQRQVDHMHGLIQPLGVATKKCVSLVCPRSTRRMLRSIEISQQYVKYNNVIERSRQGFDSRFPPNTVTPPDNPRMDTHDRSHNSRVQQDEPYGDICGRIVPSLVCCHDKTNHLCG